jgi:hypothetical protein
MRYQQRCLFKIKRKNCADVWLFRWYGTPRHYVTWIYNPSVNSRMLRLFATLKSPTGARPRTGCAKAFISKAHKLICQPLKYEGLVAAPTRFTADVPASLLFTDCYRYAHDYYPF